VSLFEHTARRQRLASRQEQAEKHRYRAHYAWESVGKAFAG
jgi:hypothetical protein